jgi:hypothetical protein
MLLNGKVGQALGSGLGLPDPQGAWIRKTIRSKT